MADASLSNLTSTNLVSAGPTPSAGVSYQTLADELKKRPVLASALVNGPKAMATDSYQSQEHGLIEPSTRGVLLNTQKESALSDFRHWSTSSLKNTLQHIQKGAQYGFLAGSVACVLSLVSFGKYLLQRSLFTPLAWAALLTTGAAIGGILGASQGLRQMLRDIKEF